MTRVLLADGVIDDLDRIASHLRSHEIENADARADGIVGSFDVLADNPLIGRPGGEDASELEIGRGTHGYVALYRFVAVANTVVVMAIRAQRERDYARHE